MVEKILFLTTYFIIPNLSTAESKVKARLAQIVPQSQEKKLRTATYILMGLKYEQTFIDQVMEGVVEMRESVTYQAILREGREEGIAQGLEIGESKALHATILMQGKRRFGTPTQATIETIDAISDVDLLTALSLRLLEVESWDELLAS